MSKKEPKTLKQATKAIDMNQVSAEGIARLIQENANLKREVATLKANPHFPEQLTVDQYNWMVKGLEDARKRFLEVIPVPAPLTEQRPKLILPNVIGEA